MPKPLPPLTPPPDPVARFSVKDLQVSVPIVAFAFLVGGVVLLIRYPGQPLTVQQPPAEARPSFAVDLHSVVLASAAGAHAGALPEALPDQRKPPCDPDLERELRGACWLPMAVERCPPGKAFLNDQGPRADGKCYTRSMRAARSPTSGEPRTGSIADP